MKITKLHWFSFPGNSAFLQLDRFIMIFRCVYKGFSMFLNAKYGFLQIKNIIPGNVLLTKYSFVWEIKAFVKFHGVFTI